MVKNTTPLHILVIEDNPKDYLLIEDYLNEEHNAITNVRASSFKEAKEKLRSCIKSYDAVLLDLSLPDCVDGEILVKDIVKLAKTSPVIILTCSSNKNFGVKALSLGISDYLVKDELNNFQLAKSIYYSIERKKIQNQLVESEKKYRSLFDYSPLPMWVLDRNNFKFLSVNDAALKMYGFSREEFLNMYVRDLWDEKEKPDIEQIIKENRDGYYRLKISHTRKSGEKIFLDVQSNPIDFDGIPARVSLVNNITAQVEAEQALINSEKRFKALVQDGSDLVMIMDFEGKFSYVSPSAKSVTGIPSDVLLKTNFFSMIHSEDVEEVKNCIFKLRKHKRLQIPSYRIKSSTNDWRWIETIVTNLILDPAVNGIIVNSRDITEFILQEKRLVESLQRYDIVAKATSDTITDYDVKNDIMLYNEGIENMFGYKLSEIEYSGSWWNDKIHPEDKARVYELVDKVYKECQPQLKIEYRFRCADGSYKYILDRSYMVKDDAGRPVRMIGSMQDISRIREYIQTIENHNARLKDIAWTQSHIVRAPLARIMGLIDLLQHDEEIEEQYHILENILSSARELDQIIRKINNQTEQITQKVF